jgi:hypothetical protein
MFHISGKMRKRRLDALIGGVCGHEEHIIGVYISYTAK